MIHNLSTQKGRNAYADAKVKKVSAIATKKYPENSICILNKESLQIKQTEFKKNTNYRVSFDEDQKGCIVFGEWMTIQRFEANFVLYVPLLQERLKRIGLIVNGKPVSFKEFKERASIRGRGYIHVLLYINPKENLFCICPPFYASTKVEGLKESYKMYCDLVNWDMEHFPTDIDRGNILWGNCGLSLMEYGKPNRDELQDEFFTGKTYEERLRENIW